MEKVRKELDSIFLDVEQTKNLMLLLEDYFYNHIGDKEFNKHLSLSSVLVGKLDDLDKRLVNLYQITKEA